MPLKLTTHSRDPTILFVIILLSSLSMNLISPVWPIYIKSLGASIVELGYVFALSNFVSATLQILSGSLSDKYGRKRLNSLGTLLGVFPPIFYYLSKNWTDLIPWVILTSVSTGVYLPIRWSIIADISKAGKRPAMFGWMNMAFLIGSTVGPLIGGFVADAFSLRTPFLICFSLMISCFVFTLMLSETKRGKRSETQKIQDEKRETSFLSVILIFSSLNIVQAVGMGITVPITPLFVKNRFSLDYSKVGLLYAIGFGLSSTLVQIPGGKIAAKYSRKKNILATIILSSPFFALFALSRSFIEAVILMFLSNAILNISWPAFQDLMMEMTPPSRWGFMNGVSATTFWVGMMIGSALSGIIWERFGMFVPYYFSAIMIFLSVIPAIFLKEKRRDV